MKEQIRLENFTEEEEEYLSKLVLLLSDPERLKTLHAGSPPENERRRADINAVARRYLMIFLSEATHIILFPRLQSFKLLSPL